MYLSLKACHVYNQVGNSNLLKYAFTKEMLQAKGFAITLLTEGGLW